MKKRHNCSDNVMKQKILNLSKHIIKKTANIVYDNKPNPLRPMLQYVKDNNDNRELTGVEIGVSFGNNAFSMLTFLPIEKLFLVDPWVKYVDDDEKVYTRHVVGYIDAKKKLAPWIEQTVFIKNFSHKAIVDIPNELDFVYIDGNHRYEYVKRDIELYYPKIRIGGVIGGHDIHHTGVVKAFVELCKDKKHFFVGDCVNQRHPDWWVVKD